MLGSARDGAAEQLELRCCDGPRQIPAQHIVRKQLRRNVKRFRGGLVFKAHKLSI